MATTLTPNMSLPVPGVGTEAGPAYAQDVNNCLTILDAHDHTPGSGALITPSAMNINADLLFNNNNATTARSVRFQSQAAPIGSASDLGCIYESGVDLYYNDGAGNQIRITQSGGVAGTPGSISGLAPPASATYVSGNQTFVFQSNTLTPANIDGASYILRNLTASSFGLTLSPPTIGSDYQITLPQLPASTLPVVMTSSGIQGTAQIALNQLTADVQNRIVTPPTSQIFLTGSGTYTLPTSPVTPVYIRVTAVGGGGGGGGIVPGTGSAGTTTTFGTSLITCAGGASGIGGSTGVQGGVGGTATATGLSGIVFSGASGGGAGSSGGSSSFLAGGSGGSTPLGGAGAGGGGNFVGVSAVANTGSGGGGSGSANNSFTAGSGGGAGGYASVIIPNPSATYAYSVGVGGTGQSAGGSPGGSGAAGYILVEEFY